MPGRRTVNKLTDRAVKTALPGCYEDGAGLRLIVGPTGSKRWTIRLTINGRRLHKGLGGYPTVSLRAARDKAYEYRSAALEGRDLALERRARKLNAVSFSDAF